MTPLKVIRPFGQLKKLLNLSILVHVCGVLCKCIFEIDVLSGNKGVVSLATLGLLTLYESLELHFEIKFYFRIVLQLIRG